MDIKNPLAIALISPWATKQMNSWLLAETDYSYATRFPERWKNQEHLTRKWIADYVSENTLAIDIGAADGWHSRILADYFDEVIGVDINLNFVKLARQTHNLPGLGFALGDDGILLEHPGRVHLVSMCGLLTYYLGNRSAQNAIERAYDALSPGGFLLAKDSLHDPQTVLRVNRRSAAIYRSQDEWLKMFTDSGLELMHAETIQDPIGGFFSKLAFFRKPSESRLHVG